MKDLPPQKKANGMRKRLLLVDDDPAAQTSSQLYLKPDYEVYSASTLRTGTSLFNSLQPALVVLDLKLPDGNGMDLLQEIRSNNPTVPVVILTGSASIESLEDALRLGASDYLYKPIDGTAFKARIDELAWANPTIRPGKINIAHALEKAAQRIADLELKSHMADMFLHDASGPVMAALSAAQYISGAIENSEEQFGPDLTESCTLLNRAMGFVVGLFEQSRSISNLSRLTSSLVSIEIITDLAIGLVREQATSRDVALGIELRSPKSKVRVNRFAFVRALVNLLRNAIEAVPADTGRVTLRVDQVNGTVTFTVQDNGPGIDAEFMEHIFEARFSMKEEGTGLGLFICQKLVESMNGTLAVRNQPNGGCSFSIQLPAIEEPQKEPRSKVPVLQS